MFKITQIHRFSLRGSLFLRLYSSSADTFFFCVSPSSHIFFGLSYLSASSLHSPPGAPLRRALPPLIRFVESSSHAAQLASLVKSQYPINTQVYSTEVYCSQHTRVPMRDPERPPEYPMNSLSRRRVLIYALTWTGSSREISSDQEGPNHFPESNWRVRGRPLMQRGQRNREPVINQANTSCGVQTQHGSFSSKAF